MSEKYLKINITIFNEVFYTGIINIPFIDDKKHNYYNFKSIIEKYKDHLYNNIIYTNQTLTFNTCKTTKSNRFDKFKTIIDSGFYDTSLLPLMAVEIYEVLKTETKVYNYNINLPKIEKDITKFLFLDSDQFFYSLFGFPKEIVQNGYKEQMADKDGNIVVELYTRPVYKVNKKYNPESKWLDSGLFTEIEKLIIKRQIKFEQDFKTLFNSPFNTNTKDTTNNGNSWEDKFRNRVSSKPTEVREQFVEKVVKGEVTHDIIASFYESKTTNTK